MATDPAPGSDPAASTFAGSVDAALSDMRSSSKWLLGAFAATGAVVFAGLQLTSLGNINARSDPWRVPTSMVGFGLTTLGIGIAIGAIGSFLRRFSVTAKDLVLNSGPDYEAARRSLANDPSVLGIYTAVAEVWKDLEECVTQLRAEESQPGQDRADAINAVLENAVTRASAVISSRRYRRSLRVVAGGVVLAAIGAGAFAVAVAQPKQLQATLPTVVRPLTTVDIAILPTAPQGARIHELLGPACDLSKLSGVVLEQEGADSFVVAVASTSSCHSASITLAPTDAVVSLPEPTSGAKG